MWIWTMSALPFMNTSIKGVDRSLKSHPMIPHLAAFSAVYFSSRFSVPVPSDITKNLPNSDGVISEKPAFSLIISLITSLVASKAWKGKSADHYSIKEIPRKCYTGLLAATAPSTRLNSSCAPPGFGAVKWWAGRNVGAADVPMQTSARSTSTELPFFTCEATWNSQPLLNPREILHQSTSRVEKMTGWSFLMSKQGMATLVRVWLSLVLPRSSLIFLRRYCPSYLGPMRACVDFTRPVNGPLADVKDWLHFTYS